MKTNLSFFKQVGIAFRGYGKAVSFIFEKGLWIYFIYSLIIGALLFLAGFGLLHSLADYLEEYIVSSFFSDDMKNSFLGDALNLLLSVGLNILFFFVASTLNKYVLLILMSPIMSLLSERTEEIITGKKYPFSFSQLLKDVARGSLIALRNMMIEFGFIFLGLIVVWIPVLGWGYGIFLLFVSWYFYGFSMLDYVSERRKLGISGSVSFVRSHKGLAIGNGFLFAVIFTIPLIGGMLAAVAAPVAACAAVLEM